ncbi:unnamed protein product [Calypogeia fissa]
MGSKISFRGRNDKKPVLMKETLEAGAYAENDDSMTLMDMIRNVQKPARKQQRHQQQKRSAGLVAEGERQYHEVIIAVTDFPSGSEDDLGSVVCQIKRKRKCKDLCDILDRDLPLVRAQDDNSQPRKAKKLARNSELTHEKGQLANAGLNGRHKITAESCPPKSTRPNSKTIRGKLERCGSSRAGDHTEESDDLREIVGTLKSFSESMGFSKPIGVTDGLPVNTAKPLGSRAASAALNSNAGGGGQSSSQSESRQNSVSESDLVPVSSASLHTCADAKNCQNACVAKAVAPHLDHMSEQELIDWYQEVTGTQFTCRNGEKVRGRIRRVIRAEAKTVAVLAPAKSSEESNNCKVFHCDEAEKCVSNLEPRTPSPLKLVINIQLHDSPLANGCPTSIGSKEETPCAFNSASPFDEYEGEENETMSPNRSEALKDQAELEDCRLCTEEGLTLKCEPVETSVVIDEPSILEGVNLESGPIDIVPVLPDINPRPDSFGEVETECRDAPSPTSGKTTKILPVDMSSDVIHEPDSFGERETECGDTELPFSDEITKRVSSDIASGVNHGPDSFGKAETGCGDAPSHFSEKMTNSIPVDISSDVNHGQNSVGELGTECGDTELPTSEEMTKNVPIDIVSDVNHEPDSVGELEPECGDAELPCSKEMTVTGEECCNIANSPQRESEGQSLLPSVDSEVDEGAPSIGIEASHSPPVDVKDSEGLAPLLNVSRIDNRETTSHQPTADSTSKSMECARSSDAVELFGPVANEDVLLPIQQKCGIGEGDAVSSDEEKLSKIGPESPLSSPTSGRALFSPNVRPSFPSGEQSSFDSQYDTTFQATGHGDSDNSPKPSLDFVLDYAVELAGDLKPNCDDQIMPIQCHSNEEAPPTKDDAKREESIPDSTQDAVMGDGFSDFQGTASVQGDLQGQITESHGDSDNSPKTSLDYILDYAVELARDLKPNCDDRIIPIQCNSNVEAPTTKDDEEREEAAPDSTQDEVMAVGFSDFQGTAPVQGELQGQITESAEGTPQEASEQVYDICCSPNSQQCVDNLNRLELVDISGNSRHVQMSVQDESQESCVPVVEQNIDGTLVEVGEMPLEDGSHLLGSSCAGSDTSKLDHKLVKDIDDGHAETCSMPNEVVGLDGKGVSHCHDSLVHCDILEDRSDTSKLDHNELVNDSDGPAENFCAPHKVEGIDGEGSQNCDDSLGHCDIPGDEIGVLGEENVPTVQDSAAGTGPEDGILSLEEYLAAALREDDAASPQDLEEDVTVQGFEEEDVATDLMESQRGSREGQVDGTTDELVDELATQQVLGNVACCQTSDIDNVQVDGMSSLNGRQADEDVAVLETKDMDVAKKIPESSRNGNSGEELSTQQGEAPSQLTEEFEVQDQAEAEADVAPLELECLTSQVLEGVGAEEANEKEVPSRRNSEQGDTVSLAEGPLRVESMEEDVTPGKMVSCVNQVDGNIFFENVTVPNPEDDAGCKVTEEGMLQKDGTTIEVNEVLATLEIVKMVLAASDQLPQEEVPTGSDIVEDTTPQDLEKDQSALSLEEQCASLRIHDGTTQELKVESSSLHVDDKETDGEHHSRCSGEGGIENQANLNVPPSQVAEVDVPHFDEDTAARQKEEAALQSVEGNAAPDQIAELSESSLSGPVPLQCVEEIAPVHQMDAIALSTCHKLGEDDQPMHAPNLDELHSAEGGLEVRDDRTTKHGMNDVANANNFCEDAGEDALEYPVVLSQPRRSEIEEDGSQETMNDVERTIQAITSLSQRSTRDSLKHEKSIGAVEEKLAGSTKLSSPQSPGANSVLPPCRLNCASDWDFQSRERSNASEKGSADDHSRPHTGRMSLVSDAEIEQIDNFEYAFLQEEEWQNACKFSNQIDMSFFEENVAVSSPRKRKFNDPDNNSDPGKRVAVESPLQETVTSAMLTEENVMEDEHVPTALSRAVIERNGERSGAVYSSPSLRDQGKPLKEKLPFAKEKSERMIAREKRKLLLEYCPESNCDSATTAESDGDIDLLACEKLGEEEDSSQEFEPPSKLRCLRKTISPLSQLELMRASSGNSPPSDDCPPQKIPTFRLKLLPGLSSHQGGSAPFESEPTPACINLEPSNKSAKDEARIVPLDSSEDDTEDSCSKQELGSISSQGEPRRKFSLCLSPTSPSPESVRTDSSQEPRDSQSLIAPSSKGILKTGPQACKGVCKCDACSSKAGNAANFIKSQMKTFRLIAGHLTKEMQDLRTIIETNLSSPEETGKINETLKKSKDVEEAAEKNLATLLRDCKRYCKLTAMKPIPMRKIVFADEAGQKLCHVKTFQSQSFPKSILDLL